jgi:hypothetical protein
MFDIDIFEETRRSIGHVVELSERLKKCTFTSRRKRERSFIFSKSIQTGEELKLLDPEVAPIKEAPTAT